MRAAFARGCFFAGRAAIGLALCLAVAGLAGPAAAAGYPDRTVKIIVPHNLRVECAGTPLLGEFTLKHVSKATPHPDAPLIRISGSALMGSVVVKVVDPNAPKGLDKLRAWVG